MNILEVKNLSVNYDGIKVLSNISFSVEEGKTVAIIGPNGAGKSTLFKALLGLLDYEGQIVWHKKPEMGFVPQRFDFDKTIPMTVKEFLLLHMKTASFWLPSEASLQELKNALSHVSAEKLFNKKIGEISSGEFQRVLIARAILGKPNILLFDEPTADIDVEGEMKIYPLLKHLSSELGFTLIVISHDLNVIYKFADHVICLNKQMMCFGEPKLALTQEQLNKLYGEGVGFYVHNEH